jgi:TRAP-type C4-dicarboxylate transport system permease small subunit
VRVDGRSIGNRSATAQPQWELGQVSHVGLELLARPIMMTTSRERVSNWASILAALLYLATFLAFAYALYGLSKGGSFIESFASAYPRTFVAGIVLFAGSLIIGSLVAALKKLRGHDGRIALHSFGHR